MRFIYDNGERLDREAQTLYSLVHGATVAYAIDLHAEQNDGRIVCKACAETRVRPVRLTSDDMNRVILALGVEFSRCSRCGTDIS